MNKKKREKKMSNDGNKDWEFNHIEVKRDLKNFVTTLVMDHPPISEREARINTIGPELLDDLAKVSDLLYDDPESRVIIVRGSKNCFSGGADFGDTSDPNTELIASPWAVKKRVVKGQRIFKRFRDMPKPVIAAIEGYAFGGGLELAMNCDLRYAKEGAIMGLPEVTVGMHPGWGGTQLMSRHIGVGRTMELILLGEVIPAQKAYEIGLINGVFGKDQFERKINTLAKSIVKRCTPIGVGIAKQMVNFGGSVPLDIGLELEAYGFGIVSSTEDYKEGITSLHEQRRPKYKDK